MSLAPPGGVAENSQQPSQQSATWTRNDSPAPSLHLSWTRSGGEWVGKPRSLCTSLGSCLFLIPSFFWPPFLCADPPHHTDTYPDEIAPKIADKDLEYESRGRRATNPDFIVREREKGKTWVWGQGCYIVKQKESMGRGRPVGPRPPPESVTGRADDTETTGRGEVMPRWSCTVVSGGRGQP